MRYITSIHDNWTFFKKEGEPGVPVTLPHTWNAEDGQDGGNDYYRGRCLYARTIRRSEFPGDRQYLEIGAASQTADVYLDGKLLARHEGGYSLFRADLTGLLTDESLLEIYVDNSDSKTVYPQKADFTFYGGLYRSVKVISVPEEHFELIKDGTPGILAERRCRHLYPGGTDPHRAVRKRTRRGDIHSLPRTPLERHRGSLPLHRHRLP